MTSSAAKTRARTPDRTGRHGATFSEDSMGPRQRSIEPDPKTPEGQWALYLAHLLERRGVSEEELAKKAKVSRASVFNWLKGESPPSIRVWGSIAAALGLDDWRDLVPPDRFLRKIGQ